MQLTQSELNLTNELSQLIAFCSNVGLAIRLYSTYGKSHLDSYSKEDRHDLMFLSDSIHDFTELSEAIINRDLKRIKFLCEFQIRKFKQYMVFNEINGDRQAINTFNRKNIKRLVDVNSILITFDNIIKKLTI